MKVQELLAKLKDKSAKYDATNGSFFELQIKAHEEYHNAAQALYDHISKALNAGKTVYLYGMNSSEFKVIRTLGIGTHPNFINYSNNPNDKHTLKTCCLSAVEIIEVIKEKSDPIVYPDITCRQCEFGAYMNSNCRHPKSLEDPKDLWRNFDNNTTPIHPPNWCPLLSDT